MLEKCETLIQRSDWCSYKKEKKKGSLETDLRIRMSLDLEGRDQGDGSMN